MTPDTQSLPSASVNSDTTHTDPQASSHPNRLPAVQLKDERVVEPMSVFRARSGLDDAQGALVDGSCARLRDGLLRWLPPGVSPDRLMPSFALDEPAIAREAGEPADAGVVARFGHTMDGRHMIEVPVEAGTTLHGVGMAAADLDRSGRRYTCWNTDWPAYTDENPCLYQSHPFVYCVRPDGTAFGVLFDTTWRCEIDLEDPRAIRVRAEGPVLAVYVFEASSPQQLSERISEFTGRTPMPPRWALGYHQCRWSYYPSGRAMRIAEEFRERRIPCDVLWFDIHYMQDYRIFSFHGQRYPDPASTNERLHAMGFKTVWMIDPAPKVDEHDAVYTSGKEGDHFTLASNGEPFVGSVWAGPSCFPDFTRAETRAWWGDLYKAYMATGIDGVWNDMNEPSVFDTVSKTMPELCWHRGDETMPAGPHAMYHNVYGMLMVRASRDGILKANPEKRPFVLTRSNFMGGHRYAATWTGDNSATWKDLGRSISMVLSLSLSGQLISGPDIGGFMDDTEGDPELFARWMGIGALLPFARGHAAEGTIDKEPWSFGKACEDTCRRAIETRYKLLPYLYTCAWHAHASGAPIAAPVFYADPTDASLRDEDRAFLIGGDLLVVCDVTPAGEPGGFEDVRTPEGWRAIGFAEPDPNLPELRLRKGAAIPTGPVVQHSSEQDDAPLTILAHLDEEGRAEGMLYEDDGEGFAFESGGYRLSRIVVTKSETGTRVHLEHVEGDRAESRRELTVKLI
ncbi:MAG: glycoside hydrolase family 31 protein [Phycisphaerales bacterium]